ncbi:hypothetical protein SAMN05216419_104111 [Nitrosomonas cryotolerans]|uniref:Uncharacterized protein n=1 Tax=Nitrosomonas cryotolerans ATCC 49181 TaxID=1131553 RepID=A0A1N6GM96_9PROT|nr:hypothetical protein [Nitrosomonas cryotolerans]SFP97815.1 hypothetical protein SAMN05216419_104111 [Nitrosomonas cryotolerans]SIO08631.1 hypothetical protein SAMN02743940_0772 [Nitrosomonas cryotolerans ATCC 49181]
MKKTINIFIILACCIQNSVWSSEYVLQRSTLISPIGQSFDTLRGDIDITGTMTINDSNVVQSIIVCSVDTPPTCLSVEIKADIISTGVNDSSVILRFVDGRVLEHFLLSLDPIMTLINDSGFVEVEQWVPSQSLSDSDRQQIQKMFVNPTPVEFTGNERFSSPIINMLFSLGFIPFSE